jgi:hypothetical protein
MWRHPILKAILLAYIAWGAWHGYLHRTMHTPDGVLAEADPRQTNVANGEKIQIGRWTLTVRATYEVTARVLGSEPYHFDSLSDLVPEDLALGWGPMSDSRVLKTLEISQGNRFYYWHTTAVTLIDRESIITHSANTHVIPQNSAIAHQLERLRPGEIVTLSGQLVDAVRSDGRWIKTSLVRNDTGAGACEVMLVTDVRKSDSL